MIMSRFATIAAACALLTPAVTWAKPPIVTVQHQVMISTGLAANNPFEAWFVFDKSSDPAVPGYAVPADATISFSFPKAFIPKPGFLGVVMLTGWSQGSLPVKFTWAIDKQDPRTIVVHFDEPITPSPPERPGLKAIHLRTSEMNPAKPGDYPIKIQFVGAGPLNGTTKAVAHIAPKPVPSIAAYNQLHQARDEDWQRVKTGQTAPLPIDFLVTLPNAPRSVVSLKTHANGGLLILSDGKPIGSITTKGAPVTLTPQAFGPGFSRLGIIEVHAKAGSTPGVAHIVAALDGGTQYTINLNIDQP